MSKDLKEQISHMEAGALARLSLVIEGNQTPLEKAAGETLSKNGKGWSLYDAGIMQSLLAFYKARGFWSPKQLAVVRRILPKYTGQLLACGALKEEEAPTPPKQGELF